MADNRFEIENLDEQVRLWVDLSFIALSFKAFQNKDASYNKRLLDLGKRKAQKYKDLLGADFVKNGIKIINEASDRMLPSLRKNNAPEEDVISLIITGVIVTSNFPDHGLKKEVVLDNSTDIFAVVKKKFDETILEEIKE
jgi:hypothetical protein